MLSDQDYIFIDLINDSRIKVNIKHVNENIYKSKICKNIKPRSSDRIFVNLNLKMLPNCLKDSLFSYLIFEIKGEEDEKINFKLKSIFKKKNKIENISKVAIVIPYSNFYLNFNKPILHEYKIGRRGTNNINFNNHNVYYDSNIYNLKILPTYIIDEDFDYVQNFYDYLITSISNFQKYDYILDLDLEENLKNYEKIIFPYQQEFLDVNLFEEIFNRFKNNNQKSINLLSMGPSMLYGLEIDSSKSIIKINDKNFGLFEFHKNYCYGSLINFSIIENNHICNERPNTIGGYIKVNKNINARKLFPFDNQGNISHHLYELNFRNGKMIQISNDHMSLNFNEYSEIKEKIKNFLD